MYKVRKQWRTVPYLARRYPNADDLRLHTYNDYFNDDIIGALQDGDVPEPPVRTTGDAMEHLGEDVERYPTTFLNSGHYNQAKHDNGILYLRHKGIPTLRICDVKLQYGSTDHVKCSWKLDEVTEEECKIEIYGSEKNKQVKKTVKFCIATSDTDKLLSHIVDGYEVRYMLRTDAIRLKLELEIVPSSPHSTLDFGCVHGEVKLEIERKGNPHTIYLLHDQYPTEKPKLNNSTNRYELSIVRNVPRNLRHIMKLGMKIKDSSGTLDVDGCHRFFTYNIPVDQEDYFHFENGYIKINVFWGCCIGIGKGLCTGVCTCEPAEFIGFLSPDEVSCIKNSDE